VASTPGLGHIHPVVPIARALQLADHDVMWAVGPEMVGTIEGFGMRARTAGLDRAEAVARTRTSSPDFAARFEDATPRERRLLVWAVFVAVQGPPMLADLRPLVDDWHPDVIVHEPNETASAPLAAARAIPHVVVGYGGFVPAAVIAAAEDGLRDLWSAEGLELRPWAGLYDDLYLHPFPPSFGQARSEGTVQRLRPMGFDGGDSTEPPAWLERLGSVRQCVYVTFGTEIARMAPLGVVVEAFSDLDVDVVVTVGRDLDPASVSPRPGNVRVERYVPQHLLLARSSLLVSHAGSGAMLGAAAAGIPQLCLPVAADQFENADVVVAAGCGLALGPQQVDRDSVRDSVGRLLDGESFRSYASRVADEIREMPEPGALVPAIETLTSRRAGS
jgi:UDP:flavonoid glycosyltransferase YjiC (YdhE family)